MNSLFMLKNNILNNNMLSFISSESRMNFNQCTINVEEDDDDT